MANRHVTRSDGVRVKVQKLPRTDMGDIDPMVSRARRERVARGRSPRLPHGHPDARAPPRAKNWSPHSSDRARVCTQVDAFVAEGEQAIDSLPSHAGRINQLLSTHFPAQTLEAVHAAMRPAVEGAPALNKKVAELSSLAREEAAVASAQFRKIEMWLRLKSPAVSDGNNFGVDVQNYVVGELATMRAAMDGMMASGRDYHWARSEGLNKMHGDEKHSKVIDSSKEVKDGKEEVAKSEKESQV